MGLLYRYLRAQALHSGVLAHALSCWHRVILTSKPTSGLTYLVGQPLSWKAGFGKSLCAWMDQAWAHLCAAWGFWRERLCFSAINQINWPKVSGPEAWVVMWLVQSCLRAEADSFLSMFCRDSCGPLREKDPVWGARSPSKFSSELHPARGLWWPPSWPQLNLRCWPRPDHEDGRVWLWSCLWWRWGKWAVLYSPFCLLVSCVGVMAQLLLSREGWRQRSFFSLSPFCNCK